jgi:uncharacterized protein (TIGR03067 family)
MRRCALIGLMVMAVTRLALPVAGQETTVVEGTWLVRSLSASGRTLGSDEADIIIRFAGNTYEQTVEGQVTERGTFRIDPGVQPMSIDFEIAAGSRLRVQLGVFQVSNETLTLHLNQFDATTRPPGFELLPDHVLIVATKRK